MVRVALYGLDLWRGKAGEIEAPPDDGRPFRVIEVRIKFREVLRDEMIAYPDSVWIPEN